MNSRNHALAAQRVLRDPIALALHLVELMIVLAESVPFARIEHQLDDLSAILERAEVFHRLADRHALIAPAVLNEKRRRHVVDEGDRRARAIEVERLLRRNAAEEGADVARDVRRPVHALQIRQSRAHPRRLEATRLADDPRRHVAVSYTHLRAHETPEHLVCRLLLEK